MTLSTRIPQTIAPRISRAVSRIGVAPSDLVREGLSRVLAEFEATGAVRFGSATRRTSAATESAARRSAPRKCRQCKGGSKKKEAA